MGTDGTARTLGGPDEGVADAVDGLAQATARAKQVWAAGDFAKVGVAHVIVGEVLASEVDVHPGHRVLDVASGSGNTALAAARRGAAVTALDFVPDLLAVAARRAEAEGLQLDTRVGDAQELPFPDEAFDVVVSTFGVMFAPNQGRAADELLRVCKPGGRIGLASWTPEGLIGRSQAITARHVPPPAMAGVRPPTVWGVEDHVRGLLGDRVTGLRTARRTTDICGASAAERVAFNRTWMGPTRMAFARLDEAGQARLAAELAADLESANRATDGTLVAAAEYLEVVATRR
jgi:SAM-dependent methyltransferase